MRWLSLLLLFCLPVVFSAAQSASETETLQSTDDYFKIIEKNLNELETSLTLGLAEKERLAVALTDVQLILGKDSKLLLENATATEKISLSLELSAKRLTAFGRQLFFWKVVAISGGAGVLVLGSLLIFGGSK